MKQLPVFSIFLIVVMYRVVTADFGAAHWWLLNFCPMAALALWCPRVFSHKTGLLLPLAALLVSDVYLDAHFGAPLFWWAMLPRYGALVIVACIGMWLQRASHAAVLLTASIAGSSIYYGITNTAAWIADPGYARTFSGWIQALTVGLPGYPPTWLFFRNAVISDLCLTAAFLFCMAAAEMAIWTSAPE
jgi:hypothetical protein